MGGGKGTQNLDALVAMADKAFGISKPVLQAGAGTVLDTLKTGRVGAWEPNIAEAWEKTAQASNQAEASMAEDLSRTGTAGTPFAQQILGSMKQQAAQQLAYLPEQMRREDRNMVLSLLFPGAMSGVQTGMGGMGQAASVEAQRAAAQSQLFGQMFSAPFQSLQMGGWLGG